MDETASFESPARTSAPVLLDLRGLKCPLPVLRTRKALRGMAPGQSLRVLCTDPLAGVDIPHLVREDGHTLAEATTSAGIAAFVIVRQA